MSETHLSVQSSGIPIRLAQAKGEFSRRILGVCRIEGEEALELETGMSGAQVVFFLCPPESCVIS